MHRCTECETIEGKLVELEPEEEGDPVMECGECGSDTIEFYDEDYGKDR